MTATTKPTVAQLRFLLAIVKDGGSSITAHDAVGDWRPINTCRSNGWVTREDRVRYGAWGITAEGRDAARSADPAEYAAALPPVRDIEVGDRVRGRCVTVQDEVEGVVTKVLYKAPGFGMFQEESNDRPAHERRYVVQTEQEYATGGKRVATVVCAELVTATAADAPPIAEGMTVVRRGEDEGPRGTVLEVAKSSGFARVTFAGLEPLWIRLDRLSRADRWFGRVVSLCDLPGPHGPGHDWRSQGVNYRCPGDRIDGSHRHDLVESGMSICDYGCKQFTCACNGLAVVRHMASYGCPTGKAGALR